MSLHKNQYQSAIATYLERRQALQDKYGVKSEEYRKRVIKMNRKLDAWRCSIRRIEKRQTTLKRVDRLIRDFMDCDKIRGSMGNRSRQMQMARAIFFKHCLENRITSPWLALYTGAKDLSTPGNVRRRFTRSFPDKPENRQLWHQWKAFLQANKE